MSNRLIHYGDGRVTINDNEYEYAHLLRLIPDYSGPWGFLIRVYERGVRHYASDGSNTVRLPLVDPYCDSVCAREQELKRLIPTLRR